jgi:hypothetical protein
MEWQTPGRRLIEKATANERQVRVAVMAGISVSISRSISFEEKVIINHTRILGHGVRHIQPGRPVMEWQTPGRRLIEKATANERQVR